MNTLLLLAAGLATPPAPAALACPAPVADRGDVKAGRPLAHTFDLTHRGPPGTLTITKVEAACGCLRQELSATVLRPGETAKLTIEVNTLTQPDGPNRWHAAVGYRLDRPGTPGQPLPPPETGTVLVTIAANLSRNVAVSPPQVAFSCTGEASQVLTVHDTRSKPLRVTKAVTTSPHLTAEIGTPVLGTDRPGYPAGHGNTRRQPVTLRLSADAPPGHRDEAVVLLTDDPEYPELRVPVRVLKRAAGAVTASPDAVAVRFAAGQAEVSALVQLRAPDGKPVAVAAAEGDHPGVAVKWSPGAGPVATLRVTVAAADSGTCRVRVRLAEPAGQEVVVPVSWRR